MQTALQTDESTIDGAPNCQPKHRTPACSPNCPWPLT
jgi:hypothetical protein